MLVFTKKSDLSAFLSPLINQNKTIGFVPTMGALHEGHLSLLEKSLSENDITVMSIFVNPTQFNNLEDLDKYPRTLDKDVEKMSVLSQNIIVYAPSVEDIYEGKTTSQAFEYDGLENQMEGKHRPGHFDGVGTIVKRLFEIVQPSKAYFGEKDFQQLQIVKKLVSTHKMPISIIGCPIFREANGLAMSSRNERLSPEAREKAALIFEILKDTVIVFKTHSIKETINFVETLFKKHAEFELEYFEIADEETLLSSENKDIKNKYRGFIAVFIENIRLIDNISLN
jgi:pantoate--beta-alanine ligase